ncbi:hypothetical protein CC1G_00640 [Coprinopsis cinerea okayama7|uniref:F-box domain-containing protein n=1 Tax=Coprinopsis cinerea (strain Okayama-7 / 130 / ATCC MYA-4618 / FGSC 9003) TaxID=240176 RepID=A8N3M1_COPC7|nr:hypothetical protein CC1G_00640 [Coprinopsis cinerea okayama7\|eukprot:XP_001829461.2 hypothetical protein CC1G_00640 [Coprinopsis cinerea okayama7\
MAYEQDADNIELVELFSFDSALLVLPNELLHKILSHPDLPADDVFQLAFTCRRMKQVCLPVYLDRAGIKTPEKECNIVIPQYSQSKSYLSEDPPRHSHVLQALRLTPSITNVDALSCSFPYTPSMLEQIRHLDNLEQFIRQLKTVSTVALVFDPEDCLCAKYTGTTSDETLRLWTNGIGNLLNAIVERKCISLSVKGLRYMCSSYGFKLSSDRMVTSAIAALGRAVKRPLVAKGRNSVLSGNKWKFQRRAPGTQNHLVELSSAARAATALKHLAVSCTTLLLPPILQWTYEVLSTSPIERITFSNFKFNKFAWPIVEALFSEAAPNLPHLEFRDAGTFTLDTFHSFVGAFSNLESLSFEPWTQSSTPGTRQPTPLPRFQKLTTLRAPATWLIETGAVFTHSIPSLKNLTVVWNRQPGEAGDHDFPVVRRVLSSLSNKFPGITLEISNKLLAPTSVNNDFTNLASDTRCVHQILVVLNTDTEKMASRQVAHAMRFYLRNFEELRQLRVKVKPQYTSDGLPIEAPCVQTVQATKHAKLELFEYNSAKQRIGGVDSA